MTIFLVIDITSEIAGWLDIWDGVSFLQCSKAMYTEPTLWRRILFDWKRIGHLACPEHLDLSTSDVVTCRLVAFRTAALQKNMANPAPACRAWKKIECYTQDESQPGSHYMKERLLEFLHGADLIITSLQLPHCRILKCYDTRTGAQVLEASMPPASPVLQKHKFSPTEHDPAEYIFTYMSARNELIIARLDYTIKDSLRVDEVATIVLDFPNVPKESSYLLRLAVYSSTKEIKLVGCDMRSGYQILHAYIRLSELRENPEPVSFSVSECEPPQAMPHPYHRGGIWDRSAHFFDGNILHLVIRLPVDRTMQLAAYAIPFGATRHPSISPNMLGLLGSDGPWGHLHIFPKRHESHMLGLFEQEDASQPSPTQFYRFNLSGDGQIISMDLYALHHSADPSDYIIFSDKTFHHIIVPRYPNPAGILRTLVPPSVVLQSHHLELPGVISDELRRAPVSASYSDVLFDFNTGTMAVKLSSDKMNQLAFLHYT